LHTTYTCAFKPGCLMSHNWLHTPDCKVLNEKNKKERKNGTACAVLLPLPMICRARETPYLAHYQ